MKTFLITVALVAFTAAEPPPSKSYLPPPSGRSTGYPQGPAGGPAFDAVPEVVAARSLDTQAKENGNGFGRNGLQERGGNARFVNGLRDQSIGNFGANAVRDESDTVSLEAESSGFKSRFSYQDSEDRSGYDNNVSNARSNGNHNNGYHSRGNQAARSNGY